MPSYSSERFYKDWRYSVEKDFTSPSGDPVQYARDGLRTWGSERYKIPFPKAPRQASVNCDGSLIAIVVADDIFIYDTIEFVQVFVCKGHVSDVDALAFQPGNPKALVSSAQNHRGGSPPADPTIILWDLDVQQARPMMEASVILSIASQAAGTVVENLLYTQPPLELSAADEKGLTEAIEPVIARIVKTHNLANQRTLCGRLQGSFQSEIFSPSGAHLIYLPGPRPKSNGSDIWDVKIYSMSTHEDILTLTGHTDALMWAGYSPDETMIGTVAWDKSMRIWDAKSGHQKYKFDTKSQNWAGGFSPNSELFAGTCGDGTFYIYSMRDGVTLIAHRSGPNWMRALSWSADSNVLAVGGQGVGKLVLYDLAKKEVTQERVLSTQACPVGPDYWRMMKSYLECYAVHFVDGGKKVVVLTSGDGGIETYDLEKYQKWRFVRPGVDPELEETKGHEKKAEENLVQGGFAMTVWEDQKRRKLWFASMDGDAVRIWDVPMTK